MDGRALPNVTIQETFIAVIDLPQLLGEITGTQWFPTPELDHARNPSRGSAVDFSDGDGTLLSVAWDQSGLYAWSFNERTGQRATWTRSMLEVSDLSITVTPVRRQ